MKSQFNQLKSGIWLSYINLAISSLIPLFYTPIMLDMLGQSEYGLYSLAHSVVSYLSLLSFGFGSTVIRYIAKYRAENDKENLEKSFGFFLLLYTGMAVLVMLSGIVLSNNVETIFQKGLTEAEQEKTRILVLIMAFNSALSFSVSVYSSIVVAHERFIFRRVLDMLSTVAAPIANLIALYMGYASVGMALAATVVQFCLLPFNAIYCHKVLKLRPRFSRLPKALVNEMVIVSLFHFVGSIVDMLFWATDKVILGMLTSSVAVAIYNIGGTFNNMVMNLSSAITGVLTPKITGMVVTNIPKEEWSALFIRVGRLQFLIIALIVSGFAVFGQSFIELWAGPSYEDSYWVAVLTMFPLCIPLIQNTGLSIITAQNKHKFRSVVYLIIAIANAISTYLVVPYMGVIGAALCSCVSYLVGQGLIMNIYYKKVTGLDIQRFWKNIIKMSVVPGVLIVTGLLILHFFTIDSWLVFFGGVGSYSIIYILMMYRFSLNEYEKSFFRKPVQNVLRLAHRKK